MLTLLLHARPSRLLEIGTALGHMCANLTRWTPEDARVFTIALVRGMLRAAPGAAEQQVGARRSGVVFFAVEAPVAILSPYVDFKNDSRPLIRPRPCAGMSETSSNCWRIRVLNETGCWEYVVGRASRTAALAA